MTAPADSLLELDLDGPRRIVAPDAVESDSLLELDLEVCRFCGRRIPLNVDSECETCHAEANAALAARRARAGLTGYSPARTAEAEGAGTPADQGFLAAIAEDAARAAAAKERTQLEPSSRGASDAPVHHEDTHTNDVAIAGIKRAAAEQKERDRVARETAAIAERAAAEAKRLEEEQARIDRQAVLRGSDLIAGAAAEGHGVICGWRGKGDMTRAEITRVLERAGLPTEWTPDAVTPEAQASRALATLRADGYSVRPEKKSKRQTVEVKEYDARWLVDSPNHGAAVGDSSGDVVLVATLTGEKLELEGDEEIAKRVRTEYSDRLGAEVCKSSDITIWLQNTMVEKMDAVRMGIGWYVPRINAATATTICTAFESAGWGAEDSWVSPPMPIATGEQLRTGLLRGLSAEVRDVLELLKKERETAKTRENREDIGNKRAATFLGELKKIGKRVVAYGALLGADKVETMQKTIHDAIVALESSLSEDDRAIVSRFNNIWDELEIDRKNNGGVL